METADELFKYYVANTYLCNVPLLCLLFYGAVYVTGDSFSYRFISVFRCCYVLVQVMIMTVTATMINTKVTIIITIIIIIIILIVIIIITSQESNFSIHDIYM